MVRSARPQKAPRVRRDPDAARELILSAAERVFAERGPDAAGLQSIAREAGVSHALITHYFGTYANLVEETFARRVAAIRSAILTGLSDASLSPRDIVRLVGDALSEPVSTRLAAWALVSGRIGSADFFVAKEQGLRKVADVLEARWSERLPKRIARRDVEFVVILTLVALHGYAFGRGALYSALGRKADKNADDDFMDRLADLIEGYIRSR